MIEFRMKWLLLISGLIAIVPGILLSKAMASQPNQKDLETLLTTNKCISCDLSNANLAYANLNGSDLSGSRLSKATLINSILINSNMSNTDLSDANLYGSDLQGVDFTGSKLHGVNFNKANLHGSNISRDQLIKSKWHQAKGLNIRILEDRDLMELVEKYIKNNELQEAKRLVSFMLNRSSKSPNLLVLRATIQLKFGEYPAAINDLNIAKEQFEQNGDTESVNAIEEALSTYYNDKEKESNKYYGAGYGIQLLEAVKGIVPILTPITKRLLLPLPIF